MIANNSNATKKLAQEFARKLHGGEVVFLIGDLGSGKTTFTQGLAKGLGIKTNIKSPTFTLIKEYEIANRSRINVANNRPPASPCEAWRAGEAKLIHIDLYRLEKQAEIETLGLADYFNDKNIIIVEWPENCKNWSQKPDYIINFKHINENERQIEIKKR